MVRPDKYVRMMVMRLIGYFHGIGITVVQVIIIIVKIERNPGRSVK
jgi:hypothetical protein